MLRQRRFSRRTLLKGATVAGFGVPLVVGSSALAADGSSPPGERITMGFIGAGKMGHGHISAFAGRTDVQILAICDVQLSKRQAAERTVRQRYASRRRGTGLPGGLALSGDFREVIEAAKAGKDIYCEKPMSLTIRQARAMVEAVRRSGRVFQTGSQQRSRREFRFASEMVRSGRIGRLESIGVSVGGPSEDCYLPAEPVPDGVDWDMWLGPAPWRPYHSILCPPPSFTAYPHWRRFRDYSGGGMTDWGAHHFDIAQWGMGTDDTGPIEIIPPDGKDVKLLTYKYADGVEVTHGDGGRGVLFRGSEGEIEVARGYLRTSPESLMHKPIAPDEVHLYKSPGHHDDWIRSIRTRQKPICDVEIGARSVSVCHLGNLAYWLKRPLKWDPAKEEFIDDPGANRWLDRPKRGPWTLS